MNILLIPDKFKGSLTAKELIEALIKGINKVNPNNHIESVMASDGGEGFLQAVSQFENLDFIEMLSVNSIGQNINTCYAFDPIKKVAYIELAKSSGLDLLPKNDYNVMKGSTFGTGLQINNAIKKGAIKIFIGLGGSATNDGGIGMAAALGYRFLDTNGNELNPCGKNLIKIDSIIKPIINDFENVQFVAVNDVRNPLFGLYGAAQTYAPQKGASSNEVKLLDSGLEHLSLKVKYQLRIDIAHMPGSGAAGGAAYGLRVFFDAEFISGIDFILNRNTYLRRVKQNAVDLIITGEGKIDQQTLHGKLVYGVANWAKKHQIPVIAICGKNTLSNQSSAAVLNLLKIIEISDSSKSLDYNLKHAAKLAEKAIFEFIKQYNP